MGGWLTKAARKAVLKGYRVLRGPLFVAALMPTATSAFREECGPCGGDGAEWWPCAPIFGHAKTMAGVVLIGGPWCVAWPFFCFGR